MPGERKLLDRKGRVAKKLRISVTDRCNLACLFCMPRKERIRWISGDEILSFEEIERISRVLVSLGIEKIRITGGEPLLRTGLERLIRNLCDIPSVTSVDMTTNGWYLERKAEAIEAAGLRGVTVSLHSLRDDRFAKISGTDALPQVLRGIEKALDVGLRPVKINSVAIRGYNDDEILELVEYARERRISIRFIEFMPLDGRGIWSADRIVNGKEIIEEVSARYPLLPQGRAFAETASVWKFVDGRGDVGLVTSMSDPFCDDCDRVRLTPDGKLLSCLFDTEFYDLRHLIRNGGTDDDLATTILGAVWEKPEGVGHMPWVREGWAKPRNMNAIGG